MFRKLVLYFTSGTGNTYRCAKWINDLSTERGVDSALIPIEKGNPHMEIDGGEETLVGILTPTHGFTAPWHMIKFALSLPRVNGVKAFILATRAGTKFGQVRLPGMEGTAGYLLGLLLKLKGYDIRGIFGIDMPTNWSAIHTSLKEEKVQSIIKHAKSKVTSIFEQIFQGKSIFKGGFSLLLGIILAPISFGYLIYGRLVLSKLFFVNRSCTSCGLCAQSCPLGAIKMVGAKRTRPFWGFKCESCMRCMAYCPEKAIEAGHSWAILLTLLVLIPFGDHLVRWLTRFNPQFAPLDNWWIKLVLQYCLSLLAISLSYVLFRLLLRIPFIQRFFTYTTLTHYFKRYHEPETKVQDLGSK